MERDKDTSMAIMWTLSFLVVVLIAGYVIDLRVRHQVYEVRLLALETQQLGLQSSVDNGLRDVRQAVRSFTYTVRTMGINPQEVDHVKSDLSRMLACH